MNRLIIELPEHTYRQLVRRAEKQQKPPEQLATEQLMAEFGILVRTQNQAKRIAKDYLTSCIGDVLVPKTPSLEKNALFGKCLSLLNCL